MIKTVTWRNLGRALGVRKEHGGKLVPPEVIVVVAVRQTGTQPDGTPIFTLASVESNNLLEGTGLNEIPRGVAMEIVKHFGQSLVQHEISRGPIASLLHQLGAGASREIMDRFTGGRRG